MRALAPPPAGLVSSMAVEGIMRLQQPVQRLTRHCVALRAVVLVCAGCFSSTTTEGIKMYTMFGAAFLVASNLAIVICLPLVAPVHQPASFVFSKFYSADTSGLGIPNDACALALPRAAHWSSEGFAPPGPSSSCRRCMRATPALDVVHADGALRGSPA